MLAFGFEIVKVVGGAVGVVVGVVGVVGVVVEKGVTVVVVVEAGAVGVDVDGAVMGAVGAVEVDEGFEVLRDAVAAVGDFVIDEFSETSGETPEACGDLVMARRTVPVVDETVLVPSAVISTTGEWSLTVRKVVPGEVAETGNSTITREKTLNESANTLTEAKRRDGGPGIVSHGMMRRIAIRKLWKRPRSECPCMFSML